MLPCSSQVQGASSEGAKVQMLLALFQVLVHPPSDMGRKWHCQAAWSPVETFEGERAQHAQNTSGNRWSHLDLTSLSDQPGSRPDLKMGCVVCRCCLTTVSS